MSKLNIKKLFTKLMAVEHYTDFTLPATVGFTYFDIIKSGNVVEINIVNVNKAAAGNNFLLTLPQRFRPSQHAVSSMVLSPSGSGVGARVFRLTVATDGNVSLYNYSTALSTDSNAYATLTYIAN